MAAGPGLVGLAQSDAVRRSGSGGCVVPLPPWALGWYGRARSLRRPSQPLPRPPPPAHRPRPPSASLLVSETLFAGEWLENEAPIPAAWVILGRFKSTLFPLFDVYTFQQ